jgi:diguanylate cyclase (GGDEF)-like protein/PAS domain S-box-containing protein
VVSGIHPEEGGPRSGVADPPDVDALLDAVYADLQASRDLFRVLFEQSPDGIVLLDPFDARVPDRIIASNDSYARMNGYTVDELIGQSVGMLLTEYDDGPEENAKYVEEVRRRGTLIDWCYHKRKDGTVFPVEFSTSVVQVGGCEYILGIDRDISERKQAEEILRHHALHDALTGLPHRGLMQDRLEQALLAARRSGMQMALLFVDLDEFKAVNDTYGHAAGDVVLQGVGGRLQSVVRATDTVARIGGDEFAVVLPTVEGSGAIDVACKILLAMEAPFDCGDARISVGASVGIAVYPTHGTGRETLLQHADAAMYWAKRSGRGFAVSEDR